jgi:hypothetical protein
MASIAHKIIKSSEIVIRQTHLTANSRNQSHIPAMFYQIKPNNRRNHLQNLVSGSQTHQIQASKHRTWQETSNGGNASLVFPLSHLVWPNHHLLVAKTPKRVRRLVSLQVPTADLQTSKKCN